MSILETKFGSKKWNPGHKRIESSIVYRLRKQTPNKFVLILKDTDEIIKSSSNYATLRKLCESVLKERF